MGMTKKERRGEGRALKRAGRRGNCTGPNRDLKKITKRRKDEEEEWQGERR